MPWSGLDRGQIGVSGSWDRPNIADGIVTEWPGPETAFVEVAPTMLLSVVKA